MINIQLNIHYIIVETNFKFVPLCFGNDNLQTLQYEINVGIKDRVPGIRLRYDRDL